MYVSVETIPERPYPSLRALAQFTTRVSWSSSPDYPSLHLSSTDPDSHLRRPVRSGTSLGEVAEYSGHGAPSSPLSPLTRWRGRGHI